MASGFIQRFKGKALFGTGTLFQFGKALGTYGTFPAAGNIYEYSNATGTGNGNDTTEDTLQSFTLPANAFDAIGRSLWVYAFGTFANNAHSKTGKLYFGSSIVLSTGANTTTGGISWALELLVMKSGASAQIASGQLITGTTHGGVQNFTGTETDTAGIVIKVTGQTGTAAANDVVVNGIIAGAAN